ncbi:MULTISPECIES: recombinase family protein [unclassified Paracoccus (in: a-proteobacteria)]|uniref:recombinase family protein n=1 Tax=unclassified Paracoccus (in: a-proteobacteria) TaxID=2688777 RepID=UPI0016017384|nr:MULTISPECIES: recombinase family protein [unclassified Paracoccus (in: a-proteobacteria)]MBB1490611.1 recombinase family protein [Paracoccus sp. MC1854]MBB1499289.1 recombinase family protein [Paracoccus sp. MC1862]QQO46050.1 recombinase family protein [Paracoccus sp. MC1862]
MSSPAPVRCAIYTRKSTEEGLDQGFNTLDAQHEACAAYIASQKHEGWRLVKDRFDDGGFSGGNTDRPALQRLLAEVDAGRIGMIVVYKIDRLTRSLADFARLVERLEAKGCSFVSVTQAFNTSTSMGRLTLNVLLSFAQFEREVAGERIRDKIAASKRRGLWMGGTLPLGYDRHPDAREQVLVVNPLEAEQVQRLFNLYEETGCLTALTDQAKALGMCTKARRNRMDEEVGQRPFGRGQLYYLLTNPVYIGRVRHRGMDHPDRHPPIIGAKQWQRVQERAGRMRGQETAEGSASSPLIGKLTDEAGDRLTPTQTTKGSRRYRYYVSNRLISGPPDPTAWRLPAATLETGIATGIRAHFARLLHEHRLLAEPDLLRHGSAEEQLTAKIFDASGKSEAEARLLGLIEEGRVATDRLTLHLSSGAVAALCGLEPHDLCPDALSLTLAVSLCRRGVGAKVVIGEFARQPDPKLAGALIRAHRWLGALRQGADLGRLAHDSGISAGCLRGHLQLAFLAPEIQSAILDGTQPEHLTLHSLTRPEMPPEWDQQYRRTGISPA